MNTGSRLLSCLAIALSLSAAVPAHAQWLPYGLSVGGVEATGPRLVPDGSGGAIFAWNDDGFDELYGEVYIQRVNDGGIKQWTCCGKTICPTPVHGAAHQSNALVVSDGNGGVIVVWLDSRNEGVYFDIYAQRFNNAGTALWSDGGVPVCIAPHFQWKMTAVADGSGGAIIAWTDYRNNNDSDLYAQRINAAGVRLWNATGVAVAVAGNEQELPIALADGSGGAWICWKDHRNGNLYTDIYAGRIDATGVPQGVANGFAVCSEVGFQQSPAITSDGSGGIIATWFDDRNGWDNSDVYAQRVSSAGAVQWTANGVGVCNASGMQDVPAIAADGAGGAFVVWRDSRVFGPSLFGQRINGAGNMQWTSDGDSLAAIYPYDSEPSIISEGSGEAIVTWIGPGPASSQVVRVQRFNGSGEPQWIARGVPIGQTGAARHATLVSDGAGGAIVAWEVGPFASSIFAGHVNGQGWATDVDRPVRGPSLIVADVYPNPFSGTASLAIELAAPSAVHIDVFDVAGRKVLSLVQAQGNLSQVVELNGRDDAGQLLPSGVYFCRVRAAQGTVTRKMVITR